MMVATDSIHGSIFAVVARRKGGQGDYVMQSFQNYIDRLGLVRAELKCDQEPSTLDVADTLIKRCQSTILMVTATHSFEHFVKMSQLDTRQKLDPILC